MWLHASCQLTFEVGTPTPMLLMLRPRSGWHQWIGAERYLLTPTVPAVEFTDPFGNLCQRIVAPAGTFTVQTSADIESAEACDVAPGAPFIPVEELPNETLPFLYPSRYCEADRCSDLAAELSVDCLPGYDQCVAFVNYVRDTTRYVPGAGQEIISACEVNLRAEAVCRDMAHLCIALCRARSIPARFVVGYLEGLSPMDLHAWFEAYVGGRWYTFDPTQSDLRGGRVAIAYGRDAADVAICTQFGEPVPVVQLSVAVERRQPPAPSLR